MKFRTLMILSFVVCFFVGYFTYLYLEKKSPKDIVKAQNKEMLLLQEQNQKRGNNLANKIEYFMDSRPNPPQCFGYLYLGGGQGGPTLATVQCDAVKDLVRNGITQNIY